MVINGRALAKEILEELKVRVQKLKEKGLPAGRQGIIPTLAIILVGDNPESVAYIEQKELKATKIGAKVIVEKLPVNTPQDVILKTIEQFNNDNNICGIIVQRPVKGVSSEVLNEAVLPQKDVDGLHPNSPFDPPIAKAVINLLKSVEPNFKNKNIVVIGKGETGGRPIIRTFQKMGIEVYVIDSQTVNPEVLTKTADIIISAVGKPNVIRSTDIKEGAILLSVGLSKAYGKLIGDYDEEDIENKASFYTPTPGGVGPVNVACLLSNLVDAA